MGAAMGPATAAREGQGPARPGLKLARRPLGGAAGRGQTPRRPAAAGIMSPGGCRVQARGFCRPRPGRQHKAGSRSALHQALGARQARSDII